MNRCGCIQKPKIREHATRTRRRHLASPDSSHVEQEHAPAYEAEKLFFPVFGAWSREPDRFKLYTNTMTMSLAEMQDFWVAPQTLRAVAAFLPSRWSSHRPVHLFCCSNGDLGRMPCMYVSLPRDEYTMIVGAERLAHSAIRQLCVILVRLVSGPTYLSVDQATFSS